MTETNLEVGVTEHKPAQAGDRREIEFWFDFGSNYSYLSVMRIEDVADERDVKVLWRPFLLGPIFRSFGWESSPFVIQKEKGNYMWKDMVRQCEKYDLPWKRPSTFPRMGVLPARVVLANVHEPWGAEFCRQIMLLNFCKDHDINSPETVGLVLRELGLRADEILANAQSEPVKQQLRNQTEMAKRKGIFGAPTFFVRGEMFWGNDRLDDALVHASKAARV